MSVTDDLKAARDLIADPARWTQGAFARHKNGRVIGAEEKRASRWCAGGALMKVCRGTFDRCHQLLEEVCRKQTGRNPGIPYVNDELGHAAILQALDLAIERSAQP